MKRKLATPSRQAPGKKGAGKQVLPVVQEEVVISRVTEKTGRAVRVRIESHEERQKVPVSEMIEEVSVERVPINRYVDARTGSREEGDAVIIPVFETVSVVEQRLLLREEVRIVRRRREVRRDVEVVLRKETPIIEHRSSNPALTKESTMTQTVIGVFDTPDSAYAAKDALIDQGVDESAIFFSTKEGSAAASGLTGQPMSAIRNFLSELFGPESSQDADYYAQEISRGSVLLSVDVLGDTDVETICDVIEEAGALDIETLPVQEAAEAEEVEAQEVETEDIEAEASGGEESGEKGETVSVMEEQTKIGKRQVEKGKVRVVSRMVETPVREQLTLKEEHATIKRRPVDQPVNPEDMDALAGGTIEVEETAEMPVISKSARITEEVELGKESSERTETVEDTERHTEVNVERDQVPEQDSKRKGGKK